MSQDIPEPDWKVFRELHPLGLERFCARAVEEAERRLAEAGQSSRDRLESLYELVRQRLKDVADLFDDYRRSTALFQLARMQAHQLFNKKEMDRLSEPTRLYVNSMLEAMGK